MSSIVRLSNIRHLYGDRVALDGVSFDVGPGECFGVLGPNGGGKTTLFKILSTLIAPMSGTATIDGFDAVREQAAVRSRIGVVFQSPSLDVYLTARENLRHGGQLYGLSGPELDSRIDQALRQMGVADRADDLVRKLSGGLKRRVELAKCLLHRPAVMLLDEPSTGLDPSARNAVWEQLERLRNETDLTILMTTHYMDEAERCDRLVILDHGQIVAAGTPDELKQRIGGDCITVACDDAAAVARRIAERFGCSARPIRGAVRVERAGGAAFVADLASELGGAARTIQVGRPTLEDVFIHETGRRFDDVADEPVGAGSRSRAHRGRR